MIKDDKFDSAILDTIKENKIKPKARWTFLLKDYVVWVLGVSSLFLGSVAVSVIIYLIRNNDWDVYAELSGSLTEFILLTMPYFWIVFLAIFIFVINYNIKHTKKGYKFPLLAVFPVTILVSIFLGALFFNIGLGRAIDDVLGENIIFYDRVMNPTVMMWNQPDNGRLGGLVIDRVDDDHYYHLIDIGRNEWLIDMTELSPEISNSVRVGHSIKLIGKKQDDFYFVVGRVFNNNKPCRAMMRSRLQDVPGKHFRFLKKCGSMGEVCNYAY